MTYYTQKELSNIANGFHYEWFNNGFYNFYDSESYEESLSVLRAHAKFFDIKTEVMFLIHVYNLGTSEIEYANDNAYPSHLEWVFNGEFIQEKFGIDELEKTLESLTKKLEVKDSK